MPSSIDSTDYYFDHSADDNNDIYDDEDDENDDDDILPLLEDVFERYERRRVPDNNNIINIGDTLNVYEANDAFLLFSLENLEIDVDLDTFSALRDGVQLMSPFEEMMEREDTAQRLMEERRDALVERVINQYTRVRNPDSSDGVDPFAADDYRVWMERLGEEFHQRAAEEQDNEARQVTRLALENEDVCCVCLENFPNVVFEGGCQRNTTTTTSGVCCYPCTRMILEQRMKCPHCRAVITGFRVIVSGDVDADVAAEDVVVVD